METKLLIAITVVWSPRSREVCEKQLLVLPGSTAAQALQASGLLADDPQGEALFCGVGVWGRKVPPGHVLRAGDRVELYRALTVDPKVARRERFSRQGAKTAGLFAKRRTGAKAGY